MCFLRAEVPLPGAEATPELTLRAGWGQRPDRRLPALQTAKQAPPLLL